MQREIAISLEGRRAFCTSEAPVLAVGELEVRSKADFLFECLLAFVALMRPLACVDPAMLRPIPLVVEAFVADTAAIVDFVFVLHLNVLLETFPRSIRPIALAAFECFVVSVLLFPML